MTFIKTATIFLNNAIFSINWWFSLYEHIFDIDIQMLNGNRMEC